MSYLHGVVSDSADPTAPSPGYNYLYWGVRAWRAQSDGEARSSARSENTPEDQRWRASTGDFNARTHDSFILQSDSCIEDQQTWITVHISQDKILHPILGILMMKVNWHVASIQNIIRYTDIMQYKEFGSWSLFWLSPSNILL